MDKLYRRFKDRDFIQTAEAFLFCVVGYQHPHDRVISYLKYLPSPTGKWGLPTSRYARSMSAYTTPELTKNITWLKENHPIYVYHSNVFGIEISAVPHEHIRKYYCPRERLQQLLLEGPTDTLEEEALTLITLLAEKGGISLESFGITGSILLGIHNSGFSDIDVTVYGRENCMRIKNVLTNFYNQTDVPLRRLSGSELDKWCLDKVKSYPVSHKDAKHFYDRKWNYGLFGDRLFSVHPTKTDQEITENYGDEIYHTVGFAKIEASVMHIPEPLYIPQIYEVKDVDIKEGDRANDIIQIVTQEGFYGGIVEVGERIVAQGKQEKVVRKKSGETYCRIFVGSTEAKGMDFMKPINPLRSEAHE